MTFLTQLADFVVCQADGGQPPPDVGPFGGLLGTLAPFLLMFLVIYLLLIRPASKQRKQHQELLNSLKKDDEVVTSGGIFGKVVGLDERVVTLEIADRVKIKILRDRIAGHATSATAAQKPGQTNK